MGRAISEVLPLSCSPACQVKKLAAHNTTVMAVLFLVFGAVLFSQGLRGLT